MDTQPLNVKIDSSDARADLAALAKSLEMVVGASNKMATGLTAGVGKVSTALNGSVGSMEKFAQVAAQISKIKITGDGTKAVTEFANAMTAASRAKAIEQGKLDSYRKFIEVGSQVSRLKFGAGSFAGIQAFTAAVDGAARGRAVSAAKLKSWVDFIEVGARAQNLKFSPQTAASIQSFAAAMDAVARTRGITPSKVTALKDFFAVLATLKPMPNAQAVARDLDTIAAAAGRAGAAFGMLPPKMRGLAGAFSTASGGAAQLNNSLAQTPGHANKAAGSFGGLNSALGKLGNRFNLTYHAGTLFSAMFASFTVGGFVKAIYETSVQVGKLRSAMFFATGTTEGATAKTAEYIAMTQRLGMDLAKTADAYSRFTISAKTSGLTIDTSNKIFEGVSKTLATVGASSTQTELAFYGLTQMIMKGKVSSEEFNRQIGEQIPGNAEIGAKAMSKLEGRMVGVAEFFDKMRKGEILSKDFMIAYAEALDEEFGPLFESAMKRPDKALVRLQNSFSIFRTEVGKRGFMAALGEEFNRFSATIVDSQGKLTPMAEKLAETFGRNLASMVRTAGDLMMWFAENVDTVTSAVKLLAAVFVVHTVTQWGTALSGSVQILTTLATQARLAAAAVLGLNAAQAAGAATGVASVGKAAVSTSAAATAANAATFFGGASSVSKGGLAPAAKVAAKTSFSTPAMGAARAITSGGAIAQTAAASTLAVTGLGKVSAAGTGTLTVMSKLGNVFKMLPALMGPIGIALGVLVAGLAAISSKTTMVAGEQVKFGDIYGGVFDVMSQKFSSWWKIATEGMFSWVSDLTGVQMKAGDVFIGIAAGMTMLVESVIDGVASMIDAFQALDKATQFDFKGAKAEFAQMSARWEDNSYGDQYDAIKQATLARSVKGANSSAADDKTTAEMDAASKEMATRRLKDEAAKLDAQRDAINRQIALGQEQQISAETLRAKLMDAQKTAAEAQKSLAGAGKTAATELVNAAKTMVQITADMKNGAPIAGNITAPTAGGAFAPNAASLPYGAQMNRIATQHGVDANVMGKLIQIESAWNPKAANKDSSARGLGQFTVGTWNDFMKGNQVTKANRDTAKDPRFDATLSLTATALKMKAENERFSKVLGRDLSAGEQYLAHFLGGGGASRLFGGMATNRNARAADIIYETPKARAEAIRANPTVFKKDGSATLQDVYNWGLKKTGDTPGGLAAGSTAATAMGPSGITEEDRDKLLKQADVTREQAQRLLRRGGPQAQAIYDRQLASSNMDDVLTRSAESAKIGVNPAVSAQELDAFNAAEDRKLQRALNPFIEMNEISKDTQDVSAMRLKGMADEAAWQEKLNDLTRQEYVFDEGLLKTEKERFMAGLKTERVLNAQVAAIESMNKNVLAVAADGGDPIMADVLAQIDAIYEGGTLAEKKARAVADGVYDIYRNIARANIETQASITARDIVRGLDNKRANLSGSAASNTNEAMRSALGSMIPNGGNKTLAELSTAAEGLEVNIDGAKQNMLGFVEAAVKAEESLNRQAGILQVSRNLLDQARTAGMSDYAAARDNSLRGTLEQVTGLTNLSMGELVAEAAKMHTEINGTSISMLEFSKQIEAAKEELENRPGFERWAKSLEPFNKRLQDIKAEFMDGFASNITDALMGEDVDWSAAMKDMTKKMIRARVDEGLKSLIEKFTGQKNGGVKLSPEAQAIVDSSAKVTSAAEQAASAQTDAAQFAATNLTDSATNLNTAAEALGAAAQSLNGNGGQGAGSAGGFTADDITMALSNGLADPTAADIARKTLTPQLTGDWTSEDIQQALANEKEDPAAAAQARAAIEAAMATKDNTAALTASTEALRARGGGLGSGAVGSADLAGGTAQKPSTQFQAAMGSLAKGDVGGAVKGLVAGATNGTPQGGSFFSSINNLFKEQKNPDGTKKSMLTKVGDLMGFGQGGEQTQVVNGSGPAGAGTTVASLKVTSATVDKMTVSNVAIGGAAAGAAGAVAGAAGAAAGAPDISELLEGAAKREAETAASPDQKKGLAGFMQKIGSGVSSVFNKFTGGGSGGGGSKASSIADSFSKVGAKVGSIFGGGTGAHAKAGNAQAGVMTAGLGIVNSIMDLFGADPAKSGPDYKGFKGEQGPGWDKVKGIVGTMGGVDLSATQVAAKNNPIADALNWGLNVASGGAYGQYAGLGNMIGSTVGRFAEGGYADSPASRAAAPSVNWSSVPHYSEGTHNTSGGMPAMLHPNEAVIPLSRGRSIPVDLGDTGAKATSAGNTNVVFNIQTPDVNGFRASQASLQRKQNMAAKRARLRNLQAA